MNKTYDIFGNQGEKRALRTESVDYRAATAPKNHTNGFCNIGLA